MDGFNRKNISASTLSIAPPATYSVWPTAYDSSFPIRINNSLRNVPLLQLNIDVPSPSHVTNINEPLAGTSTLCTNAFQYINTINNVTSASYSHPQRLPQKSVLTQQYNNLYSDMFSPIYGSSADVLPVNLFSAQIPQVTIANQNSQLLSSSHLRQQQQVQSLSNISATQVVRFAAENYIIPKVEKSRTPLIDIANLEIKMKTSIPQVCLRHTSKGGCNTERCFRFHVCLKWLRDECNKKQCLAEHSFQGKENAALFEQVKSVTLGEKELKNILKCKLLFREKSNEDWSSCICIYFNKRCNFLGCGYIHVKAPYAWQFIYNDSWLFFSPNHNKIIEKWFCDPSKQFITLNPRTKVKHPTITDIQFKEQLLRIDLQLLRIDLETMNFITSNGDEYKIRRISTPSDVKIKSSFATRWLWYWNDDDDNWIFYTNAIVKDFFVLSFSDYIESFYLENIFTDTVTDLTFKLNRLATSYSINFKNMKQTDHRTGVERDIRRRPMNSQCFYVKWEEDVSFKNLWSNEQLRCQDVSKTSPEFLFIQKMIDDSLAVNDIFIQRVENSYLWETYQLKKAQMMCTYGNDLQIVNEQYLFYGTSKEVIDKICAHNFDWRQNGDTGKNYFGLGTYFANSALLASCNAVSDDGIYKWLFVALVLVGTATVGDSEMIIPPINRLTNEPFDSTVDDNQYPQVFVKYNINEYYPAYLVKFQI